jgi:two-component system chemotaxis response regulator CheB
MLLRRDGKEVRLALNQEPPVNSCRPAVDVLFRSAAEAYGPGLLAVVLTGMGQDGLVGCEHVRRAGGQVLVQDEASSVVWSMPGAVAKAGLADQVVPLEHLGAEILRRARPGPFGEGRQG